jgi:enhancing lycopene biosynthesis protein 2
MKKVAVILSGCGVFDGAEIHESVLTLLALDRAGAQAVCAAPDVTQHHVINHLTGQPVEGESRNVLVESARIARGKAAPLAKLDASSIDAVILPGGFGAAKNLCNFALAGRNFEVNAEVSRFLQDCHQAGKPIGFLCIAPAIAARLFGGEQLEFTIGNDADTAHALENGGGKHVNCVVQDVVIDRRLKIVSTPAYMLGQRISEVEAGINKLVHVILEMA